MKMRHRSDSFSPVEKINNSASKKKPKQTSLFDDPELKTLKIPSQLWQKSKTIDIKDFIIEGSAFKENQKKEMKEIRLRMCQNKIVKLDVNSKPLQYIVITNMTLERVQGNEVQHLKFIFLDIRNKAAAKSGTSRSLFCQSCSSRLMVLFNGTVLYSEAFSLSLFDRKIGWIGKLCKGLFFLHHFKVYSCTEKLTGQRRAVKAFEKEKFQNVTQERLALIRELEVMRRLYHPGVLHLYEVFENDTNVFFVLDYLEGGELFQHLKRVEGGYDEMSGAIVMKTLLSSLVYVHSLGIIHRDIKPENIILRTRNNINDACIADFGLADHYRSDGGYQFKRCGTPGYVAPEILKDKIYDFKVDVFSVGVLMFIMLTGKAPFSATSYKQLVLDNYKCNVNYQLASGLSTDALQLLKALLQEDPVKRPSAAEALKHRWFTSSQKPMPPIHLHETIYPAFIHQQSAGLYVRTPLMNQNLNQIQIYHQHKGLNASNSLSDHQPSYIEHSLQTNPPDLTQQDHATMQMWGYYQQFQQYQQFQLQQMCLQQMQLQMMKPQQVIMVDEEYVIEEELPTGFHVNTANNYNLRPPNR